MGAASSSSSSDARVFLEPRLDFVVEAVAFFAGAFVLVVIVVVVVVVVVGVFVFDEPLATFSFAEVLGVLAVDFGVLTFVVFAILARRGVFVG